MSVGRMVNKSISLSERVDNLSTVEAKLFFTWAIPHSDDFGLLLVSVRKLKAIICPHWDSTIADIECWIKDIVDSQLWVKVQFQEEEFYFIMNFFEHQNLRKDRKPQLWSSRGADWEDFNKIKNQIDGNLFVAIDRKSEKKPQREKVERKPRGSIEDVKAEILNHKQFPGLKTKYPYRNYEEIIEDMCEWWQKNKKALPKTPILAFKNWLSKTKPDEDLLEKSRQAYNNKVILKRREESKNITPLSANTLKKLKEGKGNIGNLPNR